MFNVSGGFWKKIMFSLMKNIWSVVLNLVWNIVLFCQMTTFFNRKEVGSDEPWGVDNNNEEEK